MGKSTTIARRPEAPEPESEVLRRGLLKSVTRLNCIAVTLRMVGDTDES
jgi:hypothetical protein